jgi:hypothetical protein
MTRNLKQLDKLKFEDLEGEKAPGGAFRRVLMFS